MSRRARRSLQNLGREPGWSGQSWETRLIALMRELRKGIRLKFQNRDVAVDGNVRESGDVSKVNSLWSMEQCRQGKSAKWIRLGSGVPVPNPSTVGGLLELLKWRERTASCRPGDGLGTALSGAFPGRRTANSELVRTRGIRLEEIQPSAGKQRE
ncbi:hypothetical protein YC2023_108354 [Brassica napus]